MNDSGGPSALAAPSERLGLILAFIMAAAAVCTAWAGFQSTKWSGVQVNSYAEAGSARAEANRQAIRAGQQRIIDVTSFGQWLSALTAEVIADPSARPGADYQPREGTLSGFIFKRFRPEFRQAMDAWIRTQPFTNPDAPPTPFALPEYQLAPDAEAALQEKRADTLFDDAREANQIADSYVLTAVLFALVLFFAGIADRARGRRTQVLLFVFAAVGLVATVGVLATLPIEI